VSELCATRWDQLDLDRAEFLVVRRKGGSNVPHPLRGDELRALRRLKAEQSAPSPFAFLSERGAPMTPGAFRKLMITIGQVADLPFPIHPHMLRHACGYALQNGDEPLPLRVTQAWLGHRDIRHTERYTALAPEAFRDVWRKKG
jgi:type 1 fimbriae regulatory protein FimB/type 1 fimbriae regulatory protein FimE